MNNSDRERLYNLLPTIYRQRDVAEGEPLRALLAVMESELQAIEADIEGLYENWFIETCDDWVVPYIADLVGIRGLTDKKSILFNQRSYVANAIAYRRRKGVAAILENITFDVTGWRARVVEFFDKLSVTQNVQHVRLSKGSTVDIRNRVNLERLNSPFNTIAHRVDVRRITSDRAESGKSLAAIRGKYNISNLGLFVWRLQSYPVKDSLAHPVQNLPGCYTFHPLGIDTPLFNQPQIQTESSQVSEEINLPVAIGRQVFEADLKEYQEQYKDTSPELRPSSTNYYGLNRSINIIKDGESVPPMDVVSMELSDWQRRPPEGKVAVDVSLGRLALPNPQLGSGTISSKDKTVTGSGTNFTKEVKVGYTIHADKQMSCVRAIASDTELTVETPFSPDLSSQTAFTFDLTPTKSLEVSYCYGFSADIGGGTYDRSQSLTKVSSGIESTSLSKYGKNQTLQETLTQWKKNSEEKLDFSRYVIDIIDNETYFQEKIILQPPKSSWLVIQAANGVRPAISFEKKDKALKEDIALEIEGKSPDTTLILNGLLIKGKILVKENLRLKIMHCTITGGVQVENQAQVEISHSIVGPLYLSQRHTSLTVQDSIIDSAIATTSSSDQQSSQLSYQDHYAIAASDAGNEAGSRTTLERTTVFGKVNISELALASNVLFTAPVTVQRQQTGSVEFSYVPEGSQTPRRYRCQPDLTLEHKDDDEKTRIKSRLKPSFTSVRYGNPGYAQLSLDCPLELSTGADDGSEIGAFYQLHQPQRIAYLRLSLDEYVPAGLDTGIFYVT